jgi:CRP-like cAMP-binding protein
LRWNNLLRISTDPRYACAMVSEFRISAHHLATIALLAGVPAPDLDGFAAAARARRLQAGERVFHQGDEDVRVHAVLAGGVRISQSGHDGAETVMRFLGPGHIFGAVAIFTDGRYPADAIALVATVEASWSEAEFLKLMAQHPSVALNAIRMIGRRLQEAQNRVREISTQSAERRIAHALIRLARESGRRTPDGIEIAFPLRRQDVADIAGTTHFTASRVLAAWAKAGLVLSRQQIITLRRIESLAAIAETG